MKKRSCAMTAAWLVCAAAAFADPVQSRGVIDGVTVYRGQALVSRAVPVPAGGEDAATGLVEVVVTDLPAFVIPGSLHAEGGDGMRVRSVRFRTRPVGVEDREEVRKLDQRIEQAQDKIVTNRRRTEVLGEQRAYLKSLEGFVAPTSSAELTKGVLNAETLEKLTSFIMRQREEIAVRELELGKEFKAINAELELAQRERQLVAQGSSKTVNEAVVFVGRDDDKARGGAGGGAGELKLRYLVGGATWTPSYNARRAAIGDGKDAEGVVLEYYASIQQMSGEDWSNVTMTLSTATPSLVSRAPSLTAWKVGLGEVTPEAQIAALPLEYKEKREELAKKQDAAERRWLNRATKDGEPMADARDDTGNVLFLNKLASDIQSLDLVAGVRVQSEDAGLRRAPDENLSVTYAIPGRTSLPSRDDRQLVQIASLPMTASFVKIAVPVLTGQVYDEATATNSGTTVLLAGPVTAYSNGAFVGSGELPTTAAGQAYTVGFGIDSSLRTTRELVDRTEKTQGGNRIVELTYRLTIENFGAAPASVRLMDRVPKAENADVRVELVSSAPEVSTAAEYLQGDKKDGILRWDVKVPAQAIGSGAFAVEYKFRLEYDRQKMLAGVGG